MKEQNPAAALLSAIHFAANKHRDQRRKDVDTSPYINHPIEVAEILARVGGVSDVITLQAAILHDTLEDTETTPAELDAAFGVEVRQVVEEVTDDRQLPKPERKQRQIERAPYLSERAKQVKIADKISNVRSVTETPPTHWTLERRLEYLDWTEKIINGLRGDNPMLEAYYNQILSTGRAKIKS
ncbi:bifunctional (p)ppGpp synthetase/guanosine-3',5'-bis(diphosphate) 3'-pyrophosphohydrolase [Thermoleptolyngbya sichuanensis A183]|uniref:Bifunctional (P)ppGpp synthetase/guanosine-3',5'-bis(Diphosphate) 3'-pyrophosphohydrolase n=1 Tax=Thermoleptolyngbya sichuanensis A183 TaxID=2737172 RepID=A0A6M8BQA7_9CYAN|nr:MULTISPECIES: HD domain-containing protein [Thermoleptolyngbya]QKD84485.1 bifunctional (p)ppGpp synthetase/guanosine-3',5'-bis(diphosphate) 3'-pyrophosphohydrolase [Thermoleptolyngbya sichuanensis A183]